MLKHLVKLRCYLLCGCVTACCHTTAVVAGRPATTWLQYTTSCNTQSSALEDRQKIARNMSSWLELLIKLLLLHLA